MHRKCRRSRDLCARWQPPGGGMSHDFKTAIESIRSRTCSFVRNGCAGGDDRHRPRRRLRR
jgi:hypothetical protein